MYACGCLIISRCCQNEQLEQHGLYTVPLTHYHQIYHMPYISNVLTAYSPASGAPRDGLPAPSRLVVQSNSSSSHWHKYNYHFSQAAEKKHTVKIHYNKHQVRHVYTRVNYQRSATTYNRSLHAISVVKDNYRLFCLSKCSSFLAL